MRDAIQAAGILWVAVVCAARAQVAGPHPDFPVAGRAGAPLIFLECEPEPAPAETANAVVYGGTVVEHDVDQLQVRRTDVLQLKQGHVHSRLRLRFHLDGRQRGGKYAFWPYFTLGGKAVQRFDVRAGDTTNRLSPRLSFRLSNPASYQFAWNQARSPLLLFASDRIVEVEVSGMASLRKQFDVFVLSPAELFPKGTPERSQRLRADVLGRVPKTAAGGCRIFFLEGEPVSAGDIVFRALAAIDPAEWPAASFELNLPIESMPLAEALGGLARPALVALDERYTVLGALSRPRFAWQVRRFLAKPDKRGDGLLLSGKDTETPPAAHPVVNGHPQSWLVAGCWGGPAGLTIQGLDAERTVRPNPGDPVVLQSYIRAEPTVWRPQPVSHAGACVLSTNTADYAWGQGCGYAHVYLQTEEARAIVLHSIQSGVATRAWLDGDPIRLDLDPAPPEAFKAWGGERGGRTTGRDQEGLEHEVALVPHEAPRRALLELSPGAHRLLLKFVMQHTAGETFAFAASFTGPDGTALDGVQTSVSDPDLNPVLHAEAIRIEPLFNLDAPANLPRPGDPLRVHADLRWTPSVKLRKLFGDEQTLRRRYPAELELRLTDYAGREWARRRVRGRFPARVTADFGPAPQPGYYALHAALYDEEGRLIAAYPPDGFSVVKGTAAQSERKLNKELALSYYYMAFNYPTHFPWMKRMGVFRLVGSHPNFHEALWKSAETNSLLLSADFWDQHSLQTREQKEELAEKSAAYTRWFKSMNEIDIAPSGRPPPEQWVERTKWEYEAVKEARPDGFYTGGSLVAAGRSDWFLKCLELGLDRYHDAWDVHGYPKTPPTLRGSFGNSPNESLRGVLAAYDKLGRTNTLPFWIGECHSWAEYHPDGRRGQAEAAAKMTAWCNARDNVQVIAFIVCPNLYGREKSGFSGGADTARLPAEAALYTAGALIDGLPCRLVDTGDPAVQAAWFGPTLMCWTTGPACDWRTSLPGAGPWIQVDLVGSTEPLAVGDDSAVTLSLSSSPVYILEQGEYERLIRGRE